MTLLTPDLVARLARLLRRERRREIVAYVLAAAGVEPVLLVARNWSEQAGCFSVAASEAERVARHAARLGLDVRAIIHSHRASLELSQADRAEMDAGVVPWIVIVPDGAGIRYRIHASGDGASG